MEALLNRTKDFVRGSMYEVAKLLDSISGGQIAPNHISIVSLLGHGLVVLALIENRLPEAAIFLFGFGLLDALDGALARYQKTESMRGELIDSVSDRLKEGLVFAGLGFYFADNSSALGVFLSVLALTLSYAVSYVKARGEIAYLAHSGKNKSVNRRYGVGVFGYEIRTVVLIAGFALSQPLIAVYIICVGTSITFMQRAQAIARDLKDAKNQHEN